MRLTLDPHPFARRGSDAICWVSLLHLYQASLLAGWSTAGDATGIIALQHWAAFESGRAILVLVMIACALTAAVGAVCRVGWIRILLLLPQEYILGVTAFGGLYATYLGAYLDHTAMPWPHISSDQVGFATLFGIHSVAIYRRVRDPNG